MRTEIELGAVARDSITGFTGVVVAITEWLNGCVRVSIQPKELKDGKPIEVVSFDVEQVELMSPASDRVVRKTGGPHPEPSRAATAPR